MGSLLTDMGADPQGPIALTARVFARKHPDFASELRAAGIDLRFVPSWDALLGPRRQVADVILVDYDEAGRSSDGAPMTLSGHRLVTLLARHLARERTALIVLTDLDYAELEDLAQAGVHAFLSTHQAVAVHVADVLAAIKRRQLRRTSARMPLPVVVTVPVLTPIAHVDEALVAAHASPAHAIAHA